MASAVGCCRLSIVPAIMIGALATSCQRSSESPPDGPQSSIQRETISPGVEPNPVLAAITEAAKIGDMPFDTIDEKRAFLTAGDHVLSLARQGIRDSHGDSVNLPTEASGEVRVIMRLLYFGADVAAADGKTEMAAKLCVDLVRFGSLIARSAGIAEYETGMVCHYLAAEWLAALCDKLDEVTCLDVLEELQQELDVLPPADSAMKAHLQLVVSQDGDQAADALRISGVADRGLHELQQRERISRTLQQLCRLTLAIRVFELREHRLPVSLEELAGNVLPELPQDEWREGGFVYQRRGDAYALYSMGPDGKDDGGRKVSRVELLNNVPGDLSL